jgi:hypothetical protein
LAEQKEELGGWVDMDMDMDMHGRYGYVLAQVAITDFPKLLHQHFLLYISPNPQSEDHTFVHSLAEVNSQCLPHHLSGGFVAISMLQLEDKLYISNLGDAQAFVTSWDSTTPPMAPAQG